MSDLKKAEIILKEKNCSCVFCRGSDIVVKYERGIIPLVSIAESGFDYSGFSAADRIVGKAAALLYVIIGVKSVYCGVISQRAADIFFRYGIDYEFDVLTDDIVNRENTGICPMEEAVRNTDNPSEALLLIKNKLKNIDKNQKKY